VLQHPNNTTLFTILTFLLSGELLHHHDRTKKILAIAGLGAAVTAMALGMYWHMKKSEED
jgi:hypothetical protein